MVLSRLSGRLFRRHISSFLLLLAYPCVPVVGQAAADAAPLPGQLPPLLLECESAPNYNACSVWVWHGSSYLANWQGGAVGRLTVASSDSQHLRVERLDTGGPLTGLTAIYTGEWDGNALSDGKMVATLKGGSNSLTWTAHSIVTPVLPNPQMEYTYVNWYPAQLTAYAIYNGKGNFNASVGTEVNDYRMRGEPPMNPGDSRRFSNKYALLPAQYAKGVSYPQASVIAAIYADGTTFGDPVVREAILGKRRRMSNALTAIATTVCAMGRQNATSMDIAGALEKQHAAEDARSPAGKDEIDKAYSFVEKSLTGSTNSHLAPRQGAKRSWDQLIQLRTGLDDPVQDARGELTAPAATDLSCALP